MKSAILVPIIVIVVVVAAVALIEVTGVNPFQKQPEGGVVETAIIELFDTKTFKVDGKIEANVDASVTGMEGGADLAVMQGISSVKIFVNVSSSIDQRKKDNSKTSSNISIGVDAEGMQLSGIVEAITTGDALYIKLVSVPPVLTAFLGDIDDIKDQWIEMDLVSIKEQYKETANEAGITLDDEEVEERLQELVDEMKELLSGKTIFDITQELGTEEINEISTEHYFVKADKEAAKEFVLEYVELTKKYVPDEQKEEYERNLQEAMQNFNDNFDGVWASIGGIEFDIWVEKRTGRLVRILWQKDIEPSSFGDMPEEIEGVSIKVDFSFFDFNKSVDIKAPSEHKPFQEVLSGIMSTFMPTGLESPVLPEEF